tara:strand:- start:1392 stop:1970 length:579 start_codon:yes stop_codon:yes gene_type:complete
MEQLAELSRMEQGLLRKLAALEERAEVRADDGLGQIHANATRLRTALPGERLAARAEPARAEPHEKGASIGAYEGAETRDMVEELKSKRAELQAMRSAYSQLQQMHAGVQQLLADDPSMPRTAQARTAQAQAEVAQPAARRPTRMSAPSSTSSALTSSAFPDDDAQNDDARRLHALLKKRAQVPSLTLSLSL